MKKLIFVLLMLVTASVVLSEDYSHFFSVARDSSGNSLDAANVVVYLSGTTTNANIYSDSNGTVKANPFLTDAQGNYDFFIQPGLYKIVVTKVGVGTFTVDEVSLGTQIHSDSHLSGGSDPLLIDSSAVTNGTIVNVDISNSAAIAESKLSLNHATHSNVNDPTSDQKSALTGTSGAPSSSNKYVTNSDSRLSNNRTPVSHASTHSALGSDPLSLASSQLSDVNAGTNLAADLEEEGHATEHQNGGNDEISVSGLSGVLADTQKIDVQINGSAVGTRTLLNFIDGTNVNVVGTDNPGSGRVDIEFSAPGNPEIGVWDKDYLGVETLLTSPTTKITLGYGLTGNATGNEVEFTVEGQYIDLLGDVTGTLSSTSVEKIRGYEVSGSAPSDKDILQWNNDHNSWDPTQPTSFVNVWNEGDLVESNVSILDFNPEFPVTVAEPKHVTIGFDVTQLASIPATALRTKDVSTTVPTDGQVLKYSSGTGEWEPSTDISGQTLSTYDDLGTLITNPTEGIAFNAGFDVVELTTNNAKVSLDLSEIDVVSNYLKTTNSGHPSSVLIDYGSLNSGDILTWNGSEWDATTPSPTNDITVGYLLSNGLGMADRTVNYLAFSTGLYGSEATVPPYGQVLTISTNMDKVPNGTSYKKLGTSQFNDLTDGGDSTIHYHSSDRNLANVTGTLADDKLGDIRTQTKSIVIPYPTQSKNYGFLFIPTSVTVTTVAAKSRGASCTVNVKDDGTSVLSSDLTATTTGATTAVIANPNIASLSWLEFYVGSSCGSSVTEVTITVVYTVD